MDLTHIPKIFWYSVSIAILVITGTFSWAALQSKGMTIEIANAKIAITGQLTELEKVNENLKRQLAALNNTKKELEEKIKKLEVGSSSKNKNSDYRSLLNEFNKTLEEEPINEKTFITNSKEITDLRKSILQNK